MLTRSEALSQLAEFSLLAFSELGDQAIRAVKNKAHLSCNSRPAPWTLQMSPNCNDRSQRNEEENIDHVFPRII